MASLKSTDFAGATVVVTGAGSGVGAALAKAFAGAGSRVGLSDIDAGKAEAVAAELRRGGASAESFQAEVGDAASVVALAEATSAALGPASVICVNAAVVQLGRLDERSRDELEWQLRVNVIGVLDTVQAYLPQLRQARRGTARILVTVSTSGLFAATHIGVYTASKYATLGLTETLALELRAEGIGVTALLPGPVATTHSITSQEVRPISLPGQAASPADSAAMDAETAVISDHELISADHAVRNVPRDLSAGERFIVTNAKPYPDWDVIEARHRVLRAAFERANDGVPDPDPPPTWKPKL
jgi:NAD(P)-dependent dehydrogenase (short-subunit alcohol dehydrogenase family)